MYTRLGCNAGATFPYELLFESFNRHLTLKTLFFLVVASAQRVGYAVFHTVLPTWRGRADCTTNLLLSFTQSPAQKMKDLEVSQFLFSMTLLRWMHWRKVVSVISAALEKYLKNTYHLRSKCKHLFVSARLREKKVSQETLISFRLSHVINFTCKFVRWRFCIN